MAGMGGEGESRHRRQHLSLRLTVSKLHLLSHVSVFLAAQVGTEQEGKA